MRERNGWRWLGCCVAVLSIATSATAQVRGGMETLRQQRQHARRRQLTPASSAASELGPWTAERASVVVSAESLFGVSYFRESLSAEQNGVQAEVSFSGPSFHLFTGAEQLDPFSRARLGVDAVFGPGVTLGGSVGYSSVSASADATANGVALDVGPDQGLTKSTSFVIVPRIGLVLAPSSYLGVWLRAGVGYASVTETQSNGPDIEVTGVDAVLDPMLIVTPVPHAGILVGPSLNFGLTGHVTGIDSPVPLTNTFSSFGLNAGLALLF